MIAPAYKLTEEIVRNYVEVALEEEDRWFTCFSNPTAGPWKMVKFDFGSGPEIIRRYSKEETRQDLVVYSREQRRMLLFEVKRGYSYLDRVFEKAVDTYHKEAGWFQEFFKNTIPDIDYVCSFAFASTDGEHTHEMKELDRLAHQSGIDEYFLFVTLKESSGNINGKWFMKGRKSVIDELKASLPERLERIAVV